MISVYQLKTRFQNILRPMANCLVKKGFTANQITILALLLSVLTGGLVYALHIYIIMPVILFIRMALNAIDGMMAREHNQKSNCGALLNEMADIISDIALYVPFFYILGVNLWLIMGFMLLAIITETMGIMAIEIGASRRFDGPMGKSDRAFVIGILAIVAWFNLIDTKIFDAIVMVVIVLLIMTIINRFKNALKEAG